VKFGNEGPSDGLYSLILSQIKQVTEMYLSQSKTCTWDDYKNWNEQKTDRTAMKHLEIGHQEANKKASEK
jgi:hypothetical protein